ncbi:MobF family relaxase [Pseudonocardia sp. 73-21]|uniref:MobF family relaxase n=1 Tax=Pseudonocardia sp. 73-21 TaxID=1895809 RepID=UPI00095E2320|nr:MobF family relaxase [Pseudonocardia sp. 73-21]OJY42326.1 MAG: hypothetical protein BGP03_10290 [Pseudonocardia sp. 73-21]
MLSIATGHDVRYLTKAVAQAREGYYTGAVATGEPPGLWWGAGAEALGLSGEVDADLMEAIYTNLLDPRDPAAHARSTWGDAAALGARHRKYRSAEDIYKALVAAEPSAGAERRSELLAQAERSARQAVSFIDLTFSAPKSVTVLGVSFERAANDALAAGDAEAAEAWSAHAKAVEDAVMAGATAALEYMQTNAGFSRVGHHGGGSGRWIDAANFVAARFLQHDSRDKDPQLHVHQAILNRILCSDGVWRTLDTRAIHTLRAAAAAVAERVMEAHLTRSLGVEFATRPDGKAREILGIPQRVMDLFSSRRRAVTAKTAEILNAYRDANGREPTSAERFFIAQQATLATRAGKSHDGESRDEQIARWSSQCHDVLVGGLTSLANDVLARAQAAGEAADWSSRDVVERALATVSDSKQAWTRSALIRAVSDALPGNLRIAPEDVEALLEGLADTALEQSVPVTVRESTTNLPASELLANGQSPYASPTGTLYTTEGRYMAEHAIRAAAVVRGAATLPREVADRLVQRYAESGVTLGTDQAATLRGVLTSGARVEVLMAAAGTGKSFVVGAIADAWRNGDPDTPADPEAGATGTGRRVFGLAPYQVAADVLAAEGLDARNVASWLAAQRRLDSPQPGGSGGESPSVLPGGDEAWRLRRDDLVVVDEAGTADSDTLAEISARCERAGAKVLLVGDPKQLTAIGPGGALADVVEHGIVHHLAEVRRFTNDWEGPASLRLRDGDATALDEYARHGRIRDGGTVEQAEAAAARAYLADSLDGKQSLLLVGTNAAAARVSSELRAEMVSLGHVEEHGVELGIRDWEGVTAGVGDLVEARSLAWHLRRFEDNTAAPITRQTYRVTALRPDGGLTVAPIVERRRDAADEGEWNAWGERLGTPMQLPASYVREHLSLGYASTRDSAQGRTVDTSHGITSSGATAAGVYVPGTRGRESNTFYVVTRAVAEDADTGESNTASIRSPQAVLADALTAEHEERTALAQREQAEIDARSTMTHVDRLIDVVAQHVTAGRLTATLDRLTVEGALTPRDRAAISADDAFGSLERLLRTAELAGHDAEAVLAAAVADDRGLMSAASPAQVLHHRITHSLHGRLTPNLTDLAELVPADVPEEWRRWLQDRVDAATERRHELGAETAEQAPQWAVEALGPVPDSGVDVLARQEWERRAGWAAAYRELVGYDHDRDPLGDAPAPAMAEKAALFRAAHRELGLLHATDEEASMSDGQLRARVRAYEREERWAPRFVGAELDATHEALDQARADATIWRSRADAPGTSMEDAAQLRESAREAEQRAAELSERLSQLDEVDDARGTWFAHSAKSREIHDRARAELRARGVDPDDPDDRVTAQEWLEAHRAEQLDGDTTREVRDEYDLHPNDVVEHEPVERSADDTISGPEPDIRETATPDPLEKQHPAQRRRVPPADETAEAVAGAQAALVEIRQRREAEEARAALEAEEEARRHDLSRWDDSSSDEFERAVEEPALER